MNKKGVSLVAVLLFMLIATIAGTATYKWLSSANQSSASRMRQSEAGQAAIAGIESARSWMTYHGNELGAIIKQYFANGKNPISLDAVLQPISGEKQNFSVSIVGVNTSTNTYKVKIVSTGTSSNGSTYSESAIMKVSGLYKVSVPHEGHSTDYNYSYFGGSTTYSGQTEMTSLLVNGNWSGNPPKTTTGDFVVTGNATLSGSDIDVGATTCIGGNLDANNAITSKDMYVVGTTSGTAMNITTSGDAYFVGNVNQGQQPITIGGSLTTEGTIKTNASAVTFTIAKNLCVEPGGQIYQDNFSRAFTVSGNVWMPGHNPVYTGATDAANYDKIVLGNTAESQVYIADAYPHSNYVAMRKAKEFTENHLFKRNCPSAISTDDRWEIVVGDGGGKNRLKPSDSKNICGSWGTPHWENFSTGAAYYVKYTRGWNNWSNGRDPNQKYMPYNDVHAPGPGKPPMYYFYYTGGVTDVEFKEYENENWMYFVSKGVNADDIKTEVSREEQHYYGGYYWWSENSREFKPATSDIASKFRETTPIGAYHVGGQVFYDLNTYNLYNYAHVDWSDRPTGSPYCYKSADPYRPQCGVSPWFTSQGAVTNTMPATKPFECAEGAKQHCDEIWQKKPGCDGASYKVDDILKIASDTLMKYANTAQCAKDIIGIESNDRNNFNVSKINECYKELKQNRDSASARLYNGYLVIDFPNGSWFKGTQGTLEGKYVFIIDDKNGEAMKLPPTTTSSYVMLYFPEGYNELQQTSPSSTNNYFVFSNGDIVNVQSTHWKGSMYMTASSCAKVGNFKSSQLEFYEALVNDMSNNGIICSASASKCGGTGSDPSSSTSGGAGSTSSDGYDEDYVAVGPQLHIEMESEYKNTERVANAENITPSITVLPRILYMNQDAVGQMSDYYSVVPLNGAAVTGNGAVSCSDGAPPTSGPMVTDGNLLNEGFYTCSYTEGNYRAGFYVSVSGVTSESPRVKFDSPAEVQMNGLPMQTVYLIVPGVTNSTSAEFSVDIAVINDNLSGWSISPLDGVEEQTGSSSDKIYTYKGTTSSTTNTIPLFNISAGSGAKSGSVIFVLQTPVNCTISSPGSKSFNIYGSATIKRAGIADYCSKYDCAGTIYEEIKNDDDCDVDASWVRANGSDCRAVTENNEWTCNAGNGNVEPITLGAMSYDHRYCEVFIPTENNSIVGALDDADNPEGFYTLYGSLKKKRFNLHVGFSGTSSGRVTVKTRKASTDSWTTLATCTDHSAGCDYKLFTNTYVELTVDPNGDNFSYWKCSGTSCKQTNYETSSIGLVMDDDYTFTAKFNEVDEHCFYSDFSAGSAFCSSTSDMNTCIDKCAGGNDCAVGNSAGVYKDQAKWLMIHSNGNGGKNWVAPTFSRDGYISYDGGSNVNNQSGNQGFILNERISGANGTLTARIKTDGTLAWNKHNDFLNSGFILRSNADGTEYIMLNIYGKYDGLIAGGLNTHARICYATEQGITNSSKCVEKKITTSGLGTSPAITSNTVINLSINLDGSRIHVDFNYQNDALSWLNAGVDFDLTRDWSYGSLSDNQFVGFKISDSEFKIGDIGWEAKDFSNDACFEYPSITCSFASNFLGGKVPLKTDVAPWVGYSSWFINQGSSCTENTVYYYNGCDVPYTYYKNRFSGLANSYAICRDVSSDGFYTNIYGEDGLALNGTSNPYYFEYEGNHGYMHADGQGYVRNASVVVTCNGRDYAANCGEFYVGELNACSKNESILNTVQYFGTAQQMWSIGRNVNLRDSRLVFEVEGLGDADYIDVVLEDESGVKTPSRSITIRNKDVDVNDMSNQYGFNPESVTKIYLTGSNNYTLKSITSSCPNAVGITCRNATYNGAAWQVQTQYTNGTNAKKCRAVANSSDIASTGMVECGVSGKFDLLDENFYERLNTGSDVALSYEFTVYIYDDADATELTTPADTCMVTSEAKSKSDVTCDIDNLTVVQGAGVPKLTYGFTNCPSYGCAYEVRLSDGTTLPDAAKEPVTIPAGGRSGMEWIPNVNTISNYLSEGSYYYTVTAKSPKNGGTDYKTCTTSSFTVQKAVPATGNCNISGDNLIVNISGANNQDVPVTLTYNDAIGINLGYSTIMMNESKTESINLKTVLNDPGTYTIMLRVDAKDFSCGSYTVSQPLTLTCPSNVTDQDPSQQISVMPTVIGCEGNSCSWTISGATNANGGGYGGGSISFSHNASGTQNYKLTISKSGASQECPFSVTFKEVPASATCQFSKVAYAGQSVTLNVSNIQGVSGEAHPTWTVGSETKTIDCNSSSCWSNSMTMPATAGSYPFSLTLGSQTMCSGTVDVTDPLTCSVDKTEIGIGESFTLTTTYAGACWNSSLTGNGVPSANCGSSYSVTPTAVGSQDYTYNVTAGENGSSSCTKTIVVKEKAPTCSVADMEKTVGATNIEIKPSSTGCTNGPCSYTVTGGTKGGSSGTNYYDSDDALGNKITGETTAGSVNYTLKLTNSVGDGSCDFSIDYKTESVSTCHCSCASGCNSVVTTGWNSGNTSACYFTKDASASIGAWNNSVVNVNGNNYSNTSVPFSSIEKKDGGYYIQFSGYHYPSVSFGSGSPDCSGGSVSSSSSVTSSSSMESGTVAVTKTTHQFDPGSYTITCSGAGQLVCWSPSGTAFIFKLDGSDCTAFAGEGWGSCGSGSCSSSAKTLVTSKTVKCKADW